MKNTTRKVRAKGRMDANSWWVSDLLAGCEKAWLHAGWEDIMENWFGSLHKMKKKDEVKKMEEEHQKKSVK